MRQLECNTYYLNSPVQIEKGNILLDSQTNTLILQLKLLNISDKAISAVYLNADCYDNTNHLLHSRIELNYLGLNCAAKQTFGSDTPMKLPDNNIYNIKLHIAKVMFIDGSMIDVTPQTIQIPKQQQIEEVFGGEAAGAIKRILNDSICYIPQELGSGVWLCGCGQANEKEVCIGCGIAKNKVFEAVNGEYLQQILEQEKQQRMEMERQKAQQRAETEEKLKKIGKKFALVGTPILVVIIVVTLIFTQFIIPQQQLRGVNTLVDNGEYNKALVELSKMKRYDTPERIDEIRQKKAVSLLDSGNYDTARIVIENLYDINPMIPQIQATAQILLEKGDYDNAYSMYQLTDDISPITNTLKEIRERNKEYSNKISVSSHHIVGLKADGTVIATGDNDYGQCNVSGWKDIVAVSASSYHTVGLKSDGTVVAVGLNDDGQCNVSDWTDIVAVVANNIHTIGLKADGTVIATKNNENVSNWKDIVAIAAGDYNFAGLKADGTVISKRNHYMGESFDVSGWKDIIAITAYNWHIVGLKSDGTVVATGDDTFGDGKFGVSDWKSVVAVAAGYQHTVGLKADGTVVATGDNDYGQCNVSGWKDIVAIAANGGNTIGIKKDGTIVTCGENNYGQCNVSDWDLW